MPEWRGMYEASYSPSERIYITPVVQEEESQRVDPINEAILHPVIELCACSAGCLIASPSSYHMLGPGAQGTTTRGPQTRVVNNLPGARCGLGNECSRNRTTIYQEGSDSSYYFLFRCTLSMIIRADIHHRQKKEQRQGPQLVHAGWTNRSSPRGGSRPNQVNSYKKENRWIICIPLR